MVISRNIWGASKTVAKRALQMPGNSNEEAKWFMLIKRNIYLGM